MVSLVFAVLFVRVLRVADAYRLRQVHVDVTYTAITAPHPYPWWVSTAVLAAAVTSAARHGVGFLTGTDANLPSRVSAAMCWRRQTFASRPYWKAARLLRLEVF